MGNMGKTVLVVAPHPDDETLGCGGTLLRHIAEGDEVHWLIMTEMTLELGFTPERMEEREQEITSVASTYNFSKHWFANFPTTQLDHFEKSELVSKTDVIIQTIQPHTIYLPYRNDVHSDHTVVFDTVAACSKSFRAPFIKQICAYETLSETEFGLRHDDSGFRPNLYINITEYLEKKINIMKLYKGEMGDFPFPRSEKTLRAQATLRGSQSGTQAAEAFMILKEIR